jgi:serine/threonine-protein kinase Chk2
MGICGGKDSSSNTGSPTPTQKDHNSDSKHIVEEKDKSATARISDSYILGEELGAGGFSVVKEATSKKDGEKYAVKIIEKSVIKEDIKLLKREIEIMKKVDHQNILKLHEIF